MALWGEGHIKSLMISTLIYNSALFNAERTIAGEVINGALNTGATIPDPADVKKDVNYTDIYRAPLVGTFEGGAPAKISDRG